MKNEIITLSREWLELLYDGGYCQVGMLSELRAILDNSALEFGNESNQGIKNHDGQKLLVEHILNTDKGISDTTRQILEGFLK